VSGDAKSARRRGATSSAMMTTSFHDAAWCAGGAWADLGGRRDSRLRTSIFPQRPDGCEKRYPDYVNSGGDVKGPYGTSSRRCAPVADFVTSRCQDPQLKDDDMTCTVLLAVFPRGLATAWPA